MKSTSLTQGRLPLLVLAALCAGPTGHAALNLHYNFEGVDPQVSTDVPNSAPGATINGIITNPEKVSVVSGSIVTIGGASYSLGTSISFDSGDVENAEAGHVDTGFLPTDLGVINGNTWNRDYTMMAWVNFSSTTGDNFVFGQLSGEVLHHGSRNGMLHSAHWGDDIGPDQGVNINSLPGTWHHLAFVNQGQNQSVYRDGVLVIGPGATGANANNGGTNVVIGTSLNNGSFVGLVDEVKIFGDEVLTAAQILAQATAGLTPHTLAIFTAATGTATTFTFTFSDSATSMIDLAKAKSLTFDGTDVTGLAIFSKAGPVTSIMYTPAVVPEPGSLHTFAASVTDNANNPINGSGQVRPPFVSTLVKNGGTFDTEHIWTNGSPQITGSAAAAEAVLDDPAAYPPENQIIAKTQFVHFHDDVGPPIYVAESRPFPLWDPLNGGSGFGTREDFATRSRGKFNITKAGKCWFIVNSDDGFAFRVNGVELGSAGDRGRVNSVMSADLDVGPHDVEVVYWERGGGAGLSVYILKGVSDTEPPFGEEAYELLAAWLDPADTDGDGMSDIYEAENGLNPALNDAAGDSDGDGLTNLVESQRGTRANLADTDSDGLNDNVETGTGTYVSATNTGTNPLARDTDGDTLGDAAETNTGIFVSATNAGTNPFVADTDGDTMIDGAEVTLGSNPHLATAPVTVIEGGGTWTTEHVWTKGNPQLTQGGAEAVLDDPSVYPPEDSIIVQTQYIHFHDDVAPPWFVAQSKPYPLWDPVNGGPGFGLRDDFATRSRATIKTIQSGMVWFNVNSDDGFNMFVDGVETGTAPDRGRTDSVISVDLAAGLHEVEVRHWERAGGAGLSVLVYRAITDQTPVVTADTWQLLEAFPTTPTSTIQIISYTYNPQTAVLNLTFTSEVGATYALEYTTGFLPAGAPSSALKWNPVPSHSSIAGAAGTTAIAPLTTTTLVSPAGQLPNNTQCYVRIVKL